MFMAALVSLVLDFDLNGQTAWRMRYSFELEMLRVFHTPGLHQCIEFQSSGMAHWSSTPSAEGTHLQLDTVRDRPRWRRRIHRAIYNCDRPTIESLLNISHATCDLKQQWPLYPYLTTKSSVVLSMGDKAPFAALAHHSGLKKSGSGPKISVTAQIPGIGAVSMVSFEALRSLIWA
jgi:hypothetical protein